MDLIALLGSVNKIGLLAFVIVFGILVYEIMLFRREHSKKTNPRIPNFNPASKSASIDLPDVGNSRIKPLTSSVSINKVLIILLAAVLPVIGWFTFTQKNAGPTKADNGPQVIISEAKSKGIKIFDQNWQALDIRAIPANASPLRIAVETIPGADIDRARIRINSSYWKSPDITLMYNKDKQVFYRDYQISSGESKLNIEAQLHSREDGWLGD